MLILYAAENLNQILNDLIELSEGESGLFEIIFETFAILLFFKSFWALIFLRCL